MDLNNIKNQAMNKVREASHNEKLTDSVLDKASQAAKKVTGGKYDDKIDQARGAADNYLGSNEDKHTQQKKEKPKDAPKEHNDAQ